MSSEQVRPVIECFCQILSFYGFSTITSETFRLAKFDRNEATIPLWRLIYEMMNFDPNTTSQEFSKNKFAETPKDEIVDLIKRDLCKRGYTYDQFLSLDNNMQKGSRQLLVCVGWLIYHIQLIEKCMKQCLNSISNVNEQTDENIKYDLVRQIKQAMHSNSKIRSRLQAIEYDRLTAYDQAVNNLNRYIPNHNMSSFEGQLCQYPHLISQYLSELDNERQKLNVFLFWNKHANIFWKWMESVLDQPTIPVENNALSHEIDCQHLEAEKQKFNATIDTLDSALVRLEQLWISNDDHKSIERDVSMIITSIDKQISSLFNQLLNPNSLLITESLLE